MSKIKKSLFAAAIALTAVTTTAAPASAAVIKWGYAAGAAFMDATFAPGVGTSFNPVQLSWGDPAGTTGPEGGRSALTITNGLAFGMIHTNGGSEAMSTLTHNNNVIRSEYAALDTASMRMLLALKPIDPVGPAFLPFNAEYGISFTETLNNPESGICADGTSRRHYSNNGGCRDIFVFTFGDLKTYFDYDGKEYVLSIFEKTDRLGRLSDGACAAAGAESGCFGFRTKEKRDTAIQFAFSITRVPEPAALGLFGLGLMGLGFARRRKA